MARTIKDFKRSIDDLFSGGGYREIGCKVRGALRHAAMLIVRNETYKNSAGDDMEQYTVTINRTLLNELVREEGE